MRYFQIKESNLLGVQNKAQFMMSTVRNFRDKIRQLGTQAALSQPLINGPSAEKIKEILNRTGYPLEVTQGQRKYGGPPPDWEGPASGPTGTGHEVNSLEMEFLEYLLLCLLKLFPCGRLMFAFAKIYRCCFSAMLERFRRKFMKTL